MANRSEKKKEPQKPWLAAIRCKATTHDGKPCRAPRMRGSDYCLNHNPEYQRRRRETKPVVYDEIKGENIDVITAIKSKRFLGDQFPKGLSSWVPWMACLKAIFGLSDQMNSKEKDIYFKCTQRSKLPDRPFEEVYLIIGRRGGKSFISALIAVYLAVFRDWSPYLRPGEIGYIPVIASDRDQARVVMNYIKAILTQGQLSPMLARDPLKTQIYLVNNIVIEIRTASDSGIRGYTTVAAICDELAAWKASENYSNPSVEILEALRPTQDTVEGSLLIGISTPKVRRGALWEAYDKYYGKDDPYTLVWRAPTFVMNPKFSMDKIKRAMERNPASARAEYYAEFRADIESYLTMEDLQVVTIRNRKAILPRQGIHYKAFVDPSGGKDDSFALAIGHIENNKIVIDRIKESVPTGHHDWIKRTIDEFCVILKQYGCYQVHGDEFGGQAYGTMFRERGIIYLPTKKPYRTKSEIYSMFAPLVLTQAVELLDNEVLRNQLQSLERTPSADGRDTITHPRGLHDDVANVVAGVASVLYKNIKLRLTPEYRASRLPTTIHHFYSQTPTSEYAKQETRVLEKLRAEGII